MGLSDEVLQAGEPERKRLAASPPPEGLSESAEEAGLHSSVAVVRLMQGFAQVFSGGDAHTTSGVGREPTPSRCVRESCSRPRAAHHQRRRVRAVQV